MPFDLKTLDCITRYTYEHCFFDKAHKKVASNSRRLFLGGSCRGGFRSTRIHFYGDQPIEKDYYACFGQREF